MISISKLKFVCLVLITFIMFSSCKGKLGDNDMAMNKIQNQRQNISDSQAVAKYLVATSENILSVVNYCEAVENSDLDYNIKMPISELKFSQLEILNSIEATSEKVMVTVPGKISVTCTTTNIDSKQSEFFFKKIKNHMVSQKANLSKLKSHTNDQRLLKWADTLKSKLYFDLKLIDQVHSMI